MSLGRQGRGIRGTSPGPQRLSCITLAATIEPHGRKRDSLSLYRSTAAASHTAHTTWPHLQVTYRCCLHQNIRPNSLARDVRGSLFLSFHKDSNTSTGDGFVVRGGEGQHSRSTLCLVVTRFSMSQSTSSSDHGRRVQAPGPRLSPPRRDDRSPWPMAATEMD